MVVPLRFGEPKLNDDLRVEAIDSAFSEVDLSVESDLVRPRLRRLSRGQEILDPPIGVGVGMSELLPFPLRIKSFEKNRNLGRRAAFDEVEDVGRNRGSRSFRHAIVFSSRIRVIFACSAAAIRSSSSGEWFIRDSRIASISVADFPVAQTRKMWPYRRS